MATTFSGIKKVTFNWKNTKPTEIVKTDRKRTRRGEREGRGGGENKALCIISHQHHTSQTSHSFKCGGIN